MLPGYIKKEKEGSPKKPCPGSQQPHLIQVIVTHIVPTEGTGFSLCPPEALISWEDK